MYHDIQTKARRLQRRRPRVSSQKHQRLTALVLALTIITFYAYVY